MDFDFALCTRSPATLTESGRQIDRHTHTHKHIQMHTYTLRHTQTVIGTGRVDSVRTAKWKEGRQRKKYYPISIGSKDYKVAAN